MRSLSTILIELKKLLIRVNLLRFGGRFLISLHFADRIGTLQSSCVIVQVSLLLICGEFSLQCDIVNEDLPIFSEDDKIHFVLAPARGHCLDILANYGLKKKIPRLVGVVDFDNPTFESDGHSQGD